MKKITLFLLISVLSTNLYSQKLIPAISKKAVTSRGLLDVCDFWTEKVAENIYCSVNRKVRVETFLNKQKFPITYFKNSLVPLEIKPTSLESLQLSIFKPSEEQKNFYQREYFVLFEKFEAFRRANEIKLIYSSEVPLGTEERATMFAELKPIKTMQDRLSRVKFRKDPGLLKMKLYIDNVYTLIKPNEITEEDIYERSDSRIYIEDEFFLELPKSPENPMFSITLENKLPQRLKMAVLNDNENILDMYRTWQREGRFPKEWDISLYNHTSKILQALDEGAQFDLILTDFVVPGGGGPHLVNEIRLRGNQKVTVIGNSSFRREQLDGNFLFSIGLDGFFSTEDIFSEPSGFVLWEHRIRTFFYYRSLKDWFR